jgi:hypothetical protein
VTILKTLFPKDRENESVFVHKWRSQPGENSSGAVFVGIEGYYPVTNMRAHFDVTQPKAAIIKVAPDFFGELLPNRVPGWSKKTF